MAKKLSVFWFRRDLRWHDNHALLKAFLYSEEVIPIFIFDPKILDSLSNNDRRICLLFDRLQTLNTKIGAKKIQLQYGNPELVFKNIFSKHDIQAVFCNEDYEPYAINRDTKIKDLCHEKGIEFFSLKDQLIFHKDEILSDEGKPYSIYTPFMKKWVKKLIETPLKTYHSEHHLNRISNKSLTSVKSLSAMGFSKISYQLLPPLISGSKFVEYENIRNQPLYDTTQLSVHLRFGFLSIREIVKVAHKYSESVLRELIWRSFFSQILWHHPHVVSQPFRKKYNDIEWNTDEKIALWKEGNTGFPIIDAGMRQLNKTGYMHNRVRMLTASFLVKNMGIDWRLGERYFADKLMDYDLASNNGNWQWAAGTGCDAAPYFRIFNPITQQNMYDPNLLYCKKYIENFDSYIKTTKPILDLKKTRAESIERYKQCLKNEKN